MSRNNQFIVETSEDNTTWVWEGGASKYIDALAICRCLALNPLNEHKRTRILDADGEVVIEGETWCMTG